MRRRWSQIFLVGIVLTGCSPLSAIRVIGPLPNPSGEHGLSDSTRMLLESRGLLSTFKHHPVKAAEALRPAAESGRDPEALLAAAEVTFRLGIHHEILQPRKAMTWYRDAASYATFSLQDPSSPDADFAERIHDSAVSHLLRIVSRPQLRRETWWETLGVAGITATSPTLILTPERVDNVHIATDLFVRGMNGYHKRDGFGVPLVASRDVDKDAPLDVQDTLYPGELELPGTAVLRPNGPLIGGAWRSMPIHLELRDSYNEDTIVYGSRSMTLAADYSTPIAYAANRSEVRNLGVIGTLNPVKALEQSGVIMPRPYEPGKIPVILIHGLASEPSTWLTAYNDLIDDPEIRKRYQLWSVRYPTGEPLLASAWTIRKALHETYEKLDPTGADPALKEVLVIGHSMGGIMAKMLVTDTGNALWDATFTKPIGELAASDQVKSLLADHYFMNAEPNIARVIFIATPHRGSRVANALPGKLTSSLIRADDMFTKTRKELIAANGNDLVQPFFRQRMLNGITGLSPDNPNLQVMAELPVSRGIPYHTIIAVLNRGDNVPLDRINDGVVTYESAHLDGALSEEFVSSWHGCLDKPGTSAEVARILHEHVVERDARVRLTQKLP